MPDDSYFPEADEPRPRPGRPSPNASRPPVRRRGHKAAAARVLTAGLSTSGMFAIIGTLAANHPMASDDDDVVVVDAIGWLAARVPMMANIPDVLSPAVNTRAAAAL